jgi:hypothetical protein
MKARNLVAVSALVALTVLMAAAAGYFFATRPSVAADPLPSPSPTTRPVTFAATGDSITAWALHPEGSWTTYADANGVTFTGLGWAQSGAHLTEMGINTTPVEADVFVVLAGTNDLGLQSSLPERLLLLDAIVFRANADDVIISSVPPLNAAPQLATAWNTALRLHAADMGWHFVDSWVDVRAENDTFKAGTSLDGKHPTPEAAASAGAAVHDAILETSED